MPTEFSEKTHVADSIMEIWAQSRIVIRDRAPDLLRALDVVDPTRWDIARPRETYVEMVGNLVKLDIPEDLVDEQYQKEWATSKVKKHMQCNDIISRLYYDLIEAIDPDSAMATRIMATTGVKELSKAYERLPKDLSGRVGVLYDTVILIINAWKGTHPGITDKWLSKYVTAARNMARGYKINYKEGHTATEVYAKLEKVNAYFKYLGVNNDQILSPQFISDLITMESIRLNPDMSYDEGEKGSEYASRLSSQIAKIQAQARTFREMPEEELEPLAKKLRTEEPRGSVQSEDRVTKPSVFNTTSMAETSSSGECEYCAYEGISTGFHDPNDCWFNKDSSRYIPPGKVREQMKAKYRSPKSPPKVFYKNRKYHKGKGKPTTPAGKSGEDDGYRGKQA